MKNFQILAVMAITLIVTGCLQAPAPQNVVNTEFDYKTVEHPLVDIQLNDINHNPLKGIPIQLKDSDGLLIYKGLTDAQGTFKEVVPVPTHLQNMVLEINYIGIPNRFSLSPSNNVYRLHYEGELNESHQVINSVAEAATKGTNNSGRVGATTITYMGDYNAKGVPAYLESENDNISADLLTLINTSLPENQPVPQFHPTYLTNTKKTTIEVIETADVWLTFVHEGAGWRNAIAYYTFPTANPPASSADIAELRVVFPNLSYSGSGGGLQSGNKVHLGTFEPGVSIGLALLADGWDGINSEDYYHLVYSSKAINPEPDDLLKQHNVLLYDESNELFLVGFEDIRRDNIPFNCDQDFNDAILYFSANPITAVNTENVNPIDQPGDSDGDGVTDVYDEFPDNELLAYSNYYPSEDAYGSFAFEDNWPELGDYDFNDLVMDYKFKHLLNSENKLVTIEADFAIKALGAGFRNGFGFSTDLSPSAVNTVTGNILNDTYIQLNANGTEANQAKAVFIVADNLHDHFNDYGLINTEENATHHEPPHIVMNIDFSNPVSYADLGPAPYNPFLIVNRERGREIHMPSYQPTSLANTDYFGSADDNSLAGPTSAYKSKTSLPWAINTPAGFVYPLEKADIRDGHKMFRQWSESNGYSYMDWYLDRVGYRNNLKLYHR